MRISGWIITKTKHQSIKGKGEFWLTDLTEFSLKAGQSD